MTTPDAQPEGPLAEPYELLYEQAPCGFLTMLPNGTIVGANQTLLHWTGYAIGDLVGRPLSAFLDKGSQLFYETGYLPALRLEREVREVAITIRRADGSPLPILMNSVLDRASADGSEVIRSAVFDSTTRRDYELELLHSRQAAQGSEARVRILQDAAVKFARAETEKQVAVALVESARSAFAASDVAVLMLQDDGEFRLVAGNSPIYGRVPLDALRPGPEAVRTGRFVGLSSLEEAMEYSQQVADALLEAQLQAMTVIPLLSDTGPIGVLTCFYARARRFDEDFQQLQTALGLQATQVFVRLALQRQLQHSALHDQLTGLANHALLNERMDEAIAGSDRSGHPLALLFLDLDGFKSVNDYLGHSMGDSVLQQVADRLRGEVRATDVVGRFGGDEFVVICANTTEQDAIAVADRIRASISKPFDGVPNQFSVTASIGVAVQVAPDDRRTADALLTAADEAMYLSKNAGKDRVTVAPA